ncbi:MAG: ABC transporter substrate-binding protein [Patescibacteria group bacterium]
MPLSTLFRFLKRLPRLLRLPSITRWPSLKQVRHVGGVLSIAENRVVKIARLVAAVAFIVFVVQLGKMILDEVPKNGGIYREAIVGAPQLINPLYASVNEADMDLARVMFSGLVRYDENGAITPDLAETFATNDKQTEYTVTMRPNMFWHDGEPLTVRDILFTFHAIQDPLYGSPLRVSFQGVTVTQTDERTVKFTLEKPFAPFLGSLTTGIIPEHVWGGIDPRNARNAPYNTRPIGSGPLKFKELVRNDSGFIQSIALERNPLFYRRPTYLDSVRFQFYPSFEEAVQDIRSKQVDGLHFVPKQWRSHVERKYIVLRTLQLPRYTALFFNQKQAAVLKSKEVREALGLAIDKKQILQDVLQGEGAVINSPILEGFVGYDPAFQ